MRACRVPDAGLGDYYINRGDCFRLLLEGHRLMGVFENICRAAAQVLRSLSVRTIIMSRAEGVASRNAARTHLRMWRVLESLASLGEQEGLRGDSHGQLLARKHAAFYRAVLGEPVRVRGTILERRLPCHKPWAKETLANTI